MKRIDGVRETGPVEKGATLGDRYLLERVIGTGGMATVWLAHDERLKRRVAIKVLSDTLADDEPYLRRFRREASISARLSHANLVRVFDYGAGGQRPYLVMEFLSGGTLAARLSDEAARIDAERLARELLDALRHIHEAGIVHRDVKPSNVLFGDDGRARLSDFGIARPEDATRLTQTGHVVGTLKYLAPELLRGEPATRRSDLYSLGVVLRECVGPRPSQALASVAERLTAADPRDRPSSAGEALVALGAPIESGEPTATATAVTETAPTEVLARTAALAAAGAGAVGREIRSRPMAVLGVAAVAALVIALVLVLGGGGGAPSGDHAAQRGQRQPQKTAANNESGTASTTTTPQQPEPQAPATAPEPAPTKPAKPGGSPPGLAKKPGGLPPGQAKGH